MYTVNLKRIFIVSLFIAIPFMLSAQLTYGTTGLLHAPSAEMQKDKTVMLGANFMNKEITPPTWYYHTYNYYLNVTILPWMEVAYTCTLFKAEALGLKPYGYSGFTNQDRYFSLRLRALKEGQFWKYMPAVVVGTSDPFTSSGNGVVAPTEGNGYFSRFYIAATRHVQLGRETVGVHLSYLYNKRIEYKLNGIAAGISYNPCHLFAFQPFACTSGTPKNEIFHRWIDFPVPLVRKRWNEKAETKQRVKTKNEIT